MMHVQNINVLPRWMALPLQLLSSQKGIPALMAATHSDLFVDFNGSNNTLGRVRLFPSKMESFVAVDIHHIMFSLCFVYRIVLRTAYMNETALEAFPDLAASMFLLCLPCLTLPQLISLNCASYTMTFARCIGT